MFRYFFAFGVMVACLGRCTQEQAIVATNIIGDVINTAFDLGVEDLIRDSINKNPVNREIWQGVYSSLGDVVLPSLTGDKIKIDKLSNWLTSIDKSSAGICVRRLLLPATKIINLLLRQIPSEKWASEIDKSKIGEEVRNVAVNICVKFKNMIENALSLTKKRSFWEC